MGVLGGELSGNRAAAHLPTSKAGEAIGESSVLIVKIPSNLRSG